MVRVMQAEYFEMGYEMRLKVTERTHLVLESSSEKRRRIIRKEKDIKIKKV